MSLAASLVLVLVLLLVLVWQWSRGFEDEDEDDRQDSALGYVMRSGPSESLSSAASGSRAADVPATLST